MQSANDNGEEQPRKRSAFTIMKNVRDNCKQPASKKVLMFILATYCDHDGFCYPKNETLAGAACVSSRTVKRLLRELVADGEVEILAPGIGRDKKRILCLRRYAARKGDKAVTAKQDKTVSPLNGTGYLGKASRNSHAEQPTTAKGKGVVSHKSSETRQCFSPRIRYPDSEDEMIEMLEELGIEYEPSYDGNFFEQMQASDWTIHGEPVWDWPTVYKARLKVTFPGGGY